MPNFANIDGIAGKSLQIGLGKNPFIMTVSENGAVSFNTAFDNGYNIIRTLRTPGHDGDMINLRYLKFMNNELYSQMVTFVNMKIKEALGSDDDPMTEGNLMMKPLVVENLVDPITYEVGMLAKDKFIYSVVFEIRKPFTDWYNFMFQVAVGDDLDKQRFVPWTRISGIENTMELKVCETLSEFTHVNLYFRMKEAPPIGPILPERPPFEQIFINNHDQTKIKHYMRADVDWHIVTFYLSSVDVTDQYIYDDAQWHSEYYNQFGLLDFAFNMPISLDHEGHEYAVIEINPALEFVKGFNGLEASEIHYDEGLWKRQYKFKSTTSWEWIHKMVLMHAANENDYCHVYLYDLESETPELPIMVYHIWNQIMVPDAQPQDPTTQYLQTDDKQTMRLVALPKNPKMQFDRLAVDINPNGTEIVYKGAHAEVDALYDNIDIQDGQTMGNPEDDFSFTFLSENEMSITELIEPDMTKFIHLEGAIKPRTMEMQAFYAGLEGNFTNCTFQFNDVQGSCKLIIVNPAYEWFYNHANHNGVIERLLVKDPETGDSRSIYYLNMEGYLKEKDDLVIDIPICDKNDYDIQIIFFRGDNVADTDYITIVNDLVFMGSDYTTEGAVGLSEEIPISPITYVRRPTTSIQAASVATLVAETEGGEGDDEIPHSNGYVIARVISF